MEEQIDIEEFINEQKEKETKMQINAKELLKVLTVLAKGQEQSMIGTGDSFMFSKEGIMVYAGDVIIKAPFQDIGNFTIKGDKLIKFLSKSKDINYEVVVDYSDNFLMLSDSNKTAEFAITESVKIDNLFDITAEDFIPVNSDFINALDFVKNTAIKHTDVSNHKVLEYIHINKNIVEATDGVKISRVTLNDTLFDKEFLIKADKFNKVKPTDIDSIYVGDKFVYLHNKDGIIYAVPNTDSQYVPTDGVFAQTQTDTSVEVELDNQITDCLDRLIAVSENTYQPTLTLVDNKATFVLNSGGARIKEVIKTDYTGEELVIKFDARTLKNTLVNNILSITDRGEGRGKIIRCDNNNKVYILLVKD